MLSPDELKPYLLHEDLDVREAVASYFSGCYYQDDTLVPTILEACDRYGDEENLRGLAVCSNFPLTEPALLATLDRLKTVSGRSAYYNLSSIIAHAPVDLLRRHHSRFVHALQMDREILKSIELRIRLSESSPEWLWKTLMDYAQEAQSKQYVGDIDHRYADAVIEALAPHDVPDVSTLCDLLTKTHGKASWLEIFLVNLAGARRVQETVPLLVQKYWIDTSFLLERCSDALAKIGDPEAVRLIGEAYPEAEWRFRNYTSSFLGRIKSPVSEATLTRLLASESDVTLRTSLCLGLLNLFSRDALEIVRREILAERYDPHYAELDDDILPVMDVLGIHFPEEEEWRELRRDRRQCRAEAERKIHEMAERHARLQRKGIHPLSELSIKPGRMSAMHQRPEVKAGRNDPCPCGSGKKYKKCCGAV